MISSNKITISFLPHDNDLWSFIQSKKETANLSEYIRNLIRQDLYNSHPLDEQKIADIILQSLKNTTVTIPINHESEIKNETISEEIKQTINNLF